MEPTACMFYGTADISVQALELEGDQKLPLFLLISFTTVVFCSLHDEGVKNDGGKYMNFLTTKK